MTEAVVTGIVAGVTIGSTVLGSLAAKGWFDRRRASSGNGHGNGVVHADVAAIRDGIVALLESRRQGFNEHDRESMRASQHAIRSLAEALERHDRMSSGAVQTISTTHSLLASAVEKLVVLTERISDRRTH